MSTDTTWNRFGIPDEYYDEDAPRRSGQRVLNVTWRRPKGSAQAGDRPSRPPGAALVSTATVLLGLLAVGLFVVSLQAQFRYIVAAKHQVLPSVIEAVALDLGMVIFSLLALGLARAGQPARTERGLIIVCAAGSAAMNVAAANDGSPRSVAAYIAPPVLLAVVVDRVVAVVRRHVLGDTERSTWAGFGRVALYGLRFALAMPSTAKGLRRQVLIMTPLPGTSAGELPPAAGRAPRGGSKRARLIAAYEALQGRDARYGDRSKVSQVARELAPGAGLAWSSARTVLYRHLDARTEASS